MIEKIQDVFRNIGNLSDIFEIVLVLATLITIFVMICQFVKSKEIKIVYIIFSILFIVSVILDSFIGEIFTLTIISIICVLGIVIYMPERHQRNNKKVVNKQSKEFLDNEHVKEELISTLIKACDHLSNRKVGAIITIEREHTLNTLVEGAVKLDALVSFEILETIFHPNTALHDGAVIIRGNRIKCASAFYQPSQKKDIPQHYGSRHRAAIGISEQSDAFTIIVSEETGQIATTIGGTITGNVSLESLKSSLRQQIIVR